MPNKRRHSGDVDRRVGARLRMIRIERGLSQTTLGKAMGLTFQQIQKYEKGDNAIATSRLPKLCQILKIEPNDLFNGHAFTKEDVKAGVFAIGLGIRIEKLGGRARNALVGFLELVERNNDTKKSTVQK